MANIIQDKRSTKLIAENQLCEGKFEISGASKVRSVSNPGATSGRSSKEIDQVNSVELIYTAHILGTKS